MAGPCQELLLCSLRPTISKFANRGLERRCDGNGCKQQKVTAAVQTHVAERALIDVCMELTAQHLAAHMSMRDCAGHLMFQRLVAEDPRRHWGYPQR